MQKTQKLYQNDIERMKQMEKDINQIKAESRDHRIRLENRKKEELDKGAHEYANYLVSMLNSGLDNLVFDPYNR